jgi:hypothetical protein
MPWRATCSGNHPNRNALPALSPAPSPALSPCTAKVYRTWLMTCMCSCLREGSEWKPKRKRREGSPCFSSPARCCATACRGGRGWKQPAR